MAESEPPSAREDGQHAMRRDDHGYRDNRGASLYALGPDVYLYVAWARGVRHAGDRAREVGWAWVWA
jgi:hypothetical protein